MEILYLASVPIMILTTIFVVIKTRQEWAFMLMTGISFIVIAVAHFFYRPYDAFNSIAAFMGVVQIVWAYVLKKRQ